MAAEWFPIAIGTLVLPRRDPKGKNQRADKVLGFESDKGKMKFFAYILKSNNDESHYYGHTKDLENRLRSHNKGKVRSTKSKRPWELHYFEKFDSKSEAYKREMFFKSIEGYNFLKEREII